MVAVAETDRQGRPFVPARSRDALARSIRVPGARLCCLALLMIVTSVSSSFGQSFRSTNSQVGHDFWGFKEGAPGDVDALAQTSDGFLWLGSPSGLFRFDGTRFELFHSPFGDEFLSTNVFTLFAPPSGGLWIGYVFGGFSFVKDGKVTNYGETASTTGNVRNFAQDKDGKVWAATTTGLWRFDLSHWQHIGPETGLPPGPLVDMRIDREGTLWAITGPMDPSTATHLVYLRRGSRQFHAPKSNLFFTGFTLDADGYVVTSPENKHLFDDTGINAEDRPAVYPLLRKGCSQIVDRTGSVWVFPAQPVVLRLPASDLLSDAVETASPTKAETYDLDPYRSAELVDREGNVWLGERKGFHRFFYSPLTAQALPKSAEGSEIFAVTPDDDGAVWITGGTQVGQPFDIFLVDHSQVKARKGPGSIVLFAYRARDKTIWLGGPAGLWYLAKDNLVRVDLPREMADQAQFLQTITEDRSGGMWVSFGRHGLYRLADGVWTPYGGRQDLPKTGVVIEFTDSLGRVWFGCTKNTLAVLDGDRVQGFGPSDGLRVGKTLAIYGRGSEIWIGGEFGLQQFDHGRFHEIHATNEQWLRGISGIVETANGDLWLNGLGGIFHVRRSEVSQALQNSAYQVKGEHFGRREGVPGVAFQTRPLKSAVEGTDGRIWFTGSTGVAWLNPNRAENNIPPPPITIQSVSADDKNYQLSSTLKFPAHTASVQITYTAISLSDPETIRFRYKLRETDKDWHEVSAASPVSYRNLSPGSYHFSVNATDTNGAWSDAIATTEFTMLPAFYQTLWFRSVCVILFLAALAGLYQLRLRQLAHQYGMRLEERLSERTRIAREFHDTLIQTIQGSKLVADDALDQSADPARMRRALEQLSEWLGRAIKEGRAALNSLRTSATETNDLAEGLRRATEECRMFNPIAATFSVDGDARNMHPVVRDEIYRIGYEAIRNASVHSKASHLHVGLKYGQDLAITVGDDGVGIPESIINSDADGHYGLQGMRERAARIGGKLRIVSSVDSGTEVSLVVPGRVAFRGTGSTGTE